MKIVQTRKLRTIEETKKLNEDKRFWLQFEKERRKFYKKIKSVCVLQFKKERAMVLKNIEELGITNDVVPTILYGDWKHIMERTYEIIGKYFYDRQLQILRSQERAIQKKANSLQSFDQINLLRSEVQDPIEDMNRNLSNIVSNVLNPSKTEEEDNRYWLLMLLAFLKLNINNKVQSVIDTTRNELISAISESQKLGETTLQAQTRIRNIYNNYINARSVLIGNTEVAGASSFGNRTASNRSGLPLIHTWIATMDNRVRDIHNGAHGQTKRMEEPFLVGGELLLHPHDTSLGCSASNVIGCRCCERVTIDRERYEK